MLAGAIAPDAGSIEFDGQAFAPRGPLQARRAGIAVIYQELSLAPDLSVQENLMLGRELHRAGFLRRDAMRARALEALAFLEHEDITPERKLSTLGPGACQLVEVARALASDAKLVIMDEPTSSLDRADVERLFSVIVRLRERDVSVIYISHALEELPAVADRYTVLRDGKHVQSGEVARTSRSALIEAMVGRTLDQAFPKVPHEPGEVLLELDRLSGARCRTMPASSFAAARSSASPAWSAPAAPSCCARCLGSSRSRAARSSSQGSWITAGGRGRASRRASGCYPSNARRKASRSGCRSSTI